MFPARFDYHRAESVDEALRLLAAHADAKLLAGGHSLLPMMKIRLAQPAALIDIGRITELSGIRVEGRGVRIGALTTHAQLAASAELAEHCPMLAEAASQVADPAVRNRGTIGGNIAHADPASDLPAVLVAAGATVHLQGSGGSRSVAAGDFFQGLMTTDLGAGEMLVAVEVPSARGGGAYLKFEHPASGYAVCGAAAVMELDGGRVRSARLCFNGVTDSPHDAAGVAAALAGQEATDAAIATAVDGHLSVDDALADAFASAEYRVALAREQGKRALALARDRAGS